MIGWIYRKSDGVGVFYGECNNKQSLLDDTDSGFTPLSRPSENHIFINGSWQESVDFVIAEKMKAIRQERDKRISAVEWMRFRHMDELVLDAENTTLTEAEYRTLLGYIKDLRDVPNAENLNLDSPAWPVKPF